MSGALLALTMLLLMQLAKVLVWRGNLAMKVMEAGILLKGQNLFS
jgi:hypothetical protein